MHIVTLKDQVLDLVQVQDLDQRRLSDCHSQ